MAVVDSGAAELMAAVCGPAPAPVPAPAASLALLIGRLDSGIILLVTGGSLSRSLAGPWPPTPAVGRPG